MLPFGHLKAENEARKTEAQFEHPVLNWAFLCPKYTRAWLAVSIHTIRSAQALLDKHSILYGRLGRLVCGVCTWALWSLLVLQASWHSTVDLTYLLGVHKLCPLGDS